MNLTNEEYSYYNNIFEKLDKNKIGHIDIKDAAIFLKKSNLSQDILKNIWSISSHTKNGLTRNDFFIALRLIALAQNGFPYTKNEIENNKPIPPLPIFSSFNNNINNNKVENYNNNNEEEEINESEYEIPEANIILYKKYFENNKDSNDNYISTKKAIEMWKRNSIKDFTIKKIANSLIPLERKGFLNLKEFQVASHLLSICNYKEITNPLPNCLLKFMGKPLNKEKIKKVKNNYKNFNDYISKNSGDNNNYINNQIELNNNINDKNNQNNFNENDLIEQKRKMSLPNYKSNLKNKISYLNDNEYEYKKDINERIKDNNSINNNENENIINEDNNNKDSLGNRKINEINNNNMDDYDSNNKQDKKNSLDSNKNIDINNNDNLDEFDLIINEKKNKSKINNNEDFYLDKNDSNNKIKIRSFKSSQNSLNTNKNNLNNVNDNILQKIIKRLDELEIKNKDNNSKISFLISKINNLQKEQHKINKEMNELKELFRTIQSKNKIKNNSPNTIAYTEKKQKLSKNLNQSNRLMGFSLNNDNKEILNSVNNEKEQEECLNQTMKNRVQKNIIIKRDEKNDIRINSPKFRNKKNNSRINQMKSTVVNHNYNLPYDSNEKKSNLNIYQSSSIKKAPLDGEK